MDDISSKCIQLKGLPVRGTDRSTVEELLDQTEFKHSYLVVAKHIEREDDIRWLVLFKSKESAESCIKSGPWNITRSGEDIVVQPDYCSACIVPDEWQEYCVENSGNEESGARVETEEEEDDSFSIIPDEKSDSVDSDDLFLSGGKSEAKNEVEEDSKDGCDDIYNTPRKDLYTHSMADGLKPEAVKSEICEKPTDEMITSMDMFRGASWHSSGSHSIKSADLFGSGNFKRSFKDEAEQEPETTDGQATANTDSAVSTEHDYENTPQMAKTEVEQAVGVLDQAGRQSGNQLDTPAGQIGQHSNQVARQPGQNDGPVGQVAGQQGHADGPVGQVVGQPGQAGEQFGPNVGLPGQGLGPVQGQGQHFGQFPVFPPMQFAMGMNNPGYSQYPYPYMQEHMHAQQKQGSQMFYPNMPAPFVMPQNQNGAPVMYMPCTYDQVQGKMVPVMPTGIPQSPTTMESSPYSSVLEPAHNYDYIRSKSSKHVDETPYVYMSRHPKREPDPDNNEPVYSSIHDSLLGSVKAPKLPPRDVSGSRQADRKQTERRETSVAVDSVDGTMVASNLKIFDETGNSLESREEEDKDDEEEMKQKEGCRKIKVTGISRSISSETIELFFENKKRSGGGDIVSVNMKTDKGEAIIEFEESEVVQQVLEKHSSSRLILTGSKLEVEVYDPQVDKHKVFVTGLAKGTSQESLELFFEAKCDHSPTTVVYGETPGTALLSFDSEPDITLLQKECSRKPLDDKFLDVFEVEVSSSIKVTGCQGNVSDDTLTFYFENKRRSQGGPVKGVEHQERTGAYIVTFVDHEDAVNVCKQRGHSLNLSEISVSLYYPCLDLDSSYVFTVPNTIELEDMGKYMRKFLLTNKVYHELFTVKLKEKYARVHWPKTSDDCIKISCTVDKNDTEGSSKVEKWSERCMVEVQGVLDRLRVDESFRIAKEAWTMFKDRLQEVTIAEPDKVAVYLNQQVHGMVVVGEEDIVQGICVQTRNLASELEQLLEAEQQSITKTRKLKRYQIILLVAAKFLDKFKKCSVTVEMSHDTGEVTFKGSKSDVDQAMDKMMQTINSFVKKTISGFRKVSVDLLFTNETRSYVKKQMMDKRVTGIWDVSRFHTLELYSKSEADLEIAEKVLTSCIKQQAISLEPHLYQITQSQQWSQTILNLKQTRQNLFQVEIKPGEVFVVAVNFCFQEVMDEIKKLFDIHSVITEFLEVDPGKFRFISLHKERNLKAIEQQFSKLQVEIKPVDRENRKGFKVIGKKDGCTLAIQQMKKTLDSVQHKDIVLNHPNITDFVHSAEGQHTLSDIEKRSECKLEVAMAVANSNAPFTPKFKVKCRLGPNSLRVTEGDMTNMLVDGIVNPTNEKMENSSGLSACIIDKGGYGIQTEFKDKCRMGKLTTGSVIVTSPGKLPCKGIVHVVVPEYQTGMRNEMKLKHAVNQCLENANKQGFKTLVMPLLGFGKNKFPLQLAVQWMLEELANNLKTAGHFENIREIYICDIRPEIVNGIISGMKNTLGKENVVKEVKGNMNPVMLGEFQRILRAIDKKEKEDPYSSLKYASNSKGSEHEEEGAVGRVATKSWEKIQASVVVGELVKQKVDVIVNSASPDLNLSYGNISKAIVRAGGDVIQDECRRNYPGGVKKNELAVTSGGRMSCQYVFHGVLISWDNGEGSSEKYMKSLVNLCLKQADKRKMHSIAFPALGTGMLGYPVEFVAQLMFDTVSEYQEDNPMTNLTKVLFVIWHGDEKAVKAFQKVEMTEKRKAKDSSRVPASENMADTFTTRRVRTTNKFKKTFDGLTVEIVQGDITQEKSEIIVNSILRDLNLNSGNVSRAILKAAGSIIQTECNAPGNQALIDRDGLVVTSAGHMTYCQKIYHIESKTTDAEWTRVILTCLERADKGGFISMAFPALGTGGKGCSPESMTKAMFEAFKQFTQGSKYKNCLKQVRIVIFQPEMVSKFVDAAQERPKQRKSMIPFRGKKRDPKEESLTIYIYGDSGIYIRKAEELLNALYVNEDVGVDRNVFKTLEGSRQKVLQDVVAKHGVEMKMDKIEKSIVLCGYERAVRRAKKDVQSFLRQYETQEDTQVYKQPVKQENYSSPGTHQSRVSDTYATPKLVQLSSSETEYYKVASKFLTETGQVYQIAQIERLQNQYVHNQYITKKQLMEGASGGQVGANKLWFSCDSYSDVATISRIGFSMTMKKSSRFGVGLSFAKSALDAIKNGCPTDSYGYRHIYLAEVLTGDYYVGQPGMQQPPMKYTNSSYDSTTDSFTNPLWFVIFDDSQACPLYHVMFKL